MFYTLKEDVKYYPKSKTLLECEKLLSEILTDMKSSATVGPYTKGNAEKSARVEKLLQRHFNFASLMIDFGGIGLMPGGMKPMGPFTIPLPSVSDAAWWESFSDHKNARSIVNGSDGLKFKDATEHAYVSMPLAFAVSYDLTGAEVLAITLHEIGHNAQDVTIMMMAIRTIFVAQLLLMRVFVQFPAYIIRLILTKINFFASVAAFIDNVIATVEVKPTAKMLQNKVFAFVYQILDLLQYGKRIVDNLLPTEALKQFFGSIASIPAMLAQSLLGGGKSSEEFADAFAAIHGYGEEINSSLIKMESADKSYGNKIYSSITNVVFLPIAFLFSPHPWAMKRAERVLIEMKALKQKASTSAQKAEIQRSIDSINATTNASKDKILSNMFWLVPTSLRGAIGDIKSAQEELLRMFADASSVQYKNDTTVDSFGARMRKEEMEVIATDMDPLSESEIIETYFGEDKWQVPEKR